MPIAAPKAALKAICVRKSRLSLSPASSSAAVVRWMSSEPASRTKRFLQVLTLHQDEDHEDDDDAGRRERRYQRSDYRHQRVQGARVRLPDLDGNRFAVRRLLKNSGARWVTCFRTLKLRLEIVQDLRCPLQRTRATTCYSPQGFDLVSKRLLIARQRFRKSARLRHHQAPEAEDDRETQDHDREHGDNARQSERLQAADEGRKHEAQEHGEGDRDEDFPAEVQAGDDERGNAHVDQGRATRLYQLDLGRRFHCALRRRPGRAVGLRAVSPGLNLSELTMFRRMQGRTVNLGRHLRGVSPTVFEIGHFVAPDQRNHGRPEP